MEKFTLRATLLCAVCLFGGAPYAGAQEVSAGARELAPVVVVSTPIIEGNRVDSFAAGSTIVTEEQIKNLNAQDLTTALRRTPGVNISRYNHIGSHGGAEGGGVFIRGMGSSRPGAEIKTFIDGVPMYMGFWNHPLLDLMSIDTAAAIQVYKSPQPQNFGNALGAINIVPKRRTEEGFQTSLHVAGGSYDTIVQRAEHAGKIGVTDYYLGQSFRKSAGHRDDADGQLTNYFGRLGVELGENWYASVLGLRTDNYAWDPGEKGASPMSRDGKYGTEAWLGAVKLEHYHGMARGSLQFYGNQGEGQQLNRPDPVRDPDAVWKFKFYGVKIREVLNFWSGSELLVGLDHDVFSAEDTRKNNEWKSPVHRITSPYVALSRLIGEKSGFYAIPSAGLRYYDHNRFSSEAAPHAGLILGYKNTQLHFGYSRGVIFPGVEVAHISRSWADRDNWKGLEAETMNHYEVGISHTWENIKADLTFFRDKGKNRYLVVLPPPPPPTYANIGDYRTQGIEATVTYSPTDDLSLFAGVTFLDSKPSTLPYAPETTFSAGVNWRFLEKFQLSMDGQYVSKMYVNRQARMDGAVNDDRVSSYCLLNGKLSYLYTLKPYNLDMEFFVAGENLTDVTYEYRPGYPMPGINGMAGVTLKF